MIKHSGPFFRAGVRERAQMSPGFLEMDGLKLNYTKFRKDIEQSLALCISVLDFRHAAPPKGGLWSKIYAKFQTFHPV